MAQAIETWKYFRECVADRASVTTFTSSYRTRGEDRHYRRRRSAMGYPPVSVTTPVWRQGHTGIFSKTLGGRGGRGRRHNHADSDRTVKR